MVETETQTLWSTDAFKALFKDQNRFSKALIVLTKNMAVKRYQFLRIVLNLLNELNIATLIFDEFSSEITTKDLLKGAEIARDFECDVIVGIGGAKTLDAAKLIALLAQNPVSEPIFESLSKKATALAIIAVPTTIQVKSAYRDLALFIDPIEERITTIKQATLRPQYSLILPEVIESLPRDLIILHALEIFYTSSEIYLLEGRDEAAIQTIIERVHEVLKSILNSTDVIDVRGLLEASQALAQIQKEITPLEAFEQAFLLLHSTIPYGAAQSICALSYYRKFALSSTYTERMAKLGMFLHVDAKGYDYPEQAQAFVNYLSELLTSLQMRSLDLTNYGVDSAAISDYVHYTQTILGENLPLSEEELYDLLEESLTS